MGQLFCLAACIYLREDFAFVALIPTYAKLISPVSSCLIAMWYVDMRRRQDGISGPAKIHQIGFDLPRLNTGMYTISAKLSVF